MKPKWNIKLDVDKREIDELIFMYARRLSSYHSEEVDPGYMQWNAERLMYLVNIAKDKK